MGLCGRTLQAIVARLSPCLESDLRWLLQHINVNLDLAWLLQGRHTAKQRVVSIHLWRARHHQELVSTCTPSEWELVVSRRPLLLALLPCHSHVATGVVDGGHGPHHVDAGAVAHVGISCLREEKVARSESQPVLHVVVGVA